MNGRAAPPLAAVLGVDTPIGLTIVRELGMHGVPVHGLGRDPLAIGAASRHCSGFSVRPGRALAEWLPERLEEIRAGALLAIAETDLLALARLPTRIGACRILTPRAGPLAAVLDKRVTLAHAAQLGIDLPESWQPDVGACFATRVNALTYPVVAKWPDPPAITPRLGQAGLPLIKAEWIHDPVALSALLDRYAPVRQWPLIQSFCPGVGLGQMIYMEQGHATLRFQHRRLHEWPPEGGVSTLCRAEPLAHHATQMARSEALLAALGWEGPAMVEYRHDPRTGRYWLMEVNGRFWGSLPLAYYCGAHFAWEQYRRMVLGETASAPPPRQDLVARYLIPETKRLARVLFRRDPHAAALFHPRPLADLLRYGLDCLHPGTRHYVFSWSDPGPWWADMRAIARKMGAWPVGNAH